MFRDVERLKNKTIKMQIENEMRFKVSCRRLGTRSKINSKFEIVSKLSGRKKKLFHRSLFTREAVHSVQIGTRIELYLHIYQEIRRTSKCDVKNRTELFHDWIGN